MEIVILKEAEADVVHIFAFLLEYLHSVKFTPPLKQMWRKFGKVAVPPVFANSKLHFLVIHIRKVSLCHEVLFSFAWPLMLPDCSISFYVIN